MIFLSDSGSDFNPSITAVTPNSSHVREANVVFPVKGLYVLFSDVKYQGKIIVMNFIVELE